METKCLYCGKLHNRKGKTCSQSCSMKLTWKTRDRSNSPFNNKEVREKAKRTQLKRYGVENVFQSEEFQKELTDRYLNDKNYKQKEEERVRKIKETKEQKYGKDYASKLAREKAVITRKSKNNGNYKSKEELDSQKKTCIERYAGIGWASNELRNKSLQTQKERYGEEYWKRYYSKQSKAEKNLLNIVTDLYPNLTIIENTKSIIENPETGYGLELDIYFPELNKAIEFNGDYFHNNQFSYNRDNLKFNLCRRKGIKLLHIWQRELTDIDKLSQRIINFIEDNKEYTLRYKLNSLGITLPEDQEWIYDRCILFARSGSKIYGTNIESSDDDFVGVVIPPAKYYYGLEMLKGYNEISGNNFYKIENTTCDVVFHTLNKFVGNCTKSVPNNLDILFCRDEDVIYMDEFGKELRSMRHEFLSKALKHKFSGYANSQLQKLLTKGSNGTGRQNLVEKYGYDTKFAMHGIRLLESAIEILENGTYSAYRPNREELVAIRNGKYTLEEIISLYEGLDNQVNELYETSSLQYSCDFNKINNWLIDLNERALNYDF